MPTGKRDALHGHRVQGRPHEPRGCIGLEDHRNPTRFRNVRIRELPEYDTGGR